MRFARISTKFVCSVVAAAGLASVHPQARGEDRKLLSFEHRQLTDTYYSEGAAAGDLNKDGHMDLAYGPYWYEGPSFEKRHEIYPPKPQPLNFYADNFFTWVYDADNDGWPDLLVVGLPGTPAFVFRNPGNPGDAHWAKHAVFPSVGNESPQFIDLLGNHQPVLVCTTKKSFGFVTPSREHPFENWTFHPISETKKEQLAHGLGVGDVNGDGKLDIVIATGWFEQPAEHADTSMWTFHETPFTNAYGGADMHVYDVNGDGKNDVITSQAAHDFGLAWYEQDRVRGQTIFRQHVIIGNRPEQNPYGVVFSELHSVGLADMDGDGLKDIITGKTYWSHHKQSPMWDAGAVVYWFQLQRTPQGIDWIPHLAEKDSGIGRQINVVDVNGDKALDILVGGMKGGHLLTQRAQGVDEKTWQAAQPKRLYADHPLLRRGPEAALDASGKVQGVIEGESLKVVGNPPGKTMVQEMSGFHPDQWSGGQQLFWNGGKAGDRLELEASVPAAGQYEIKASFTMARDYGIVQVWVDNERLGAPLDLYNFPDVLTTGTLTLGQRQLAAGPHRVTLEILGANPSAAPGNMVGLDWIQFSAR